MKSTGRHISVYLNERIGQVRAQVEGCTGKSFDVPLERFSKKDKGKARSVRKELPPDVEVLIERAYTRLKNASVQTSQAIDPRNDSSHTSESKHPNPTSSNTRIKELEKRVRDEEGQREEPKDSQKRNGGQGKNHRYRRKSGGGSKIGHIGMRRNKKMQW